MKTNVGGIDRIVRMVVGLALVSLYFLVGDAARWWSLLGVVMLATGIFRWCPAYLPFGFSTCKP